MGRCLIVDDNESFAENLAEIVRDLGEEAVVATNGTQALDLLRRCPFHLLLSDLRMPGMNGPQLLHEARRLQPELPVVIITAYSTEHEMQRASLEGCLAILNKPVPIGLLIEFFKTHLRTGQPPRS